MSGKEELRQEVMVALADWAVKYGISYKEVMDTARGTMDLIEINLEN